MTVPYCLGCFSHSWVQWEVVKVANMVTKKIDGGDAVIGHAIIQKRRCVKCGFEQWDKQSIWAG